MTGGRGTPRYAAPELWMPYPVTHKCDVYSFGMLLFEIIGERRNHDINLPESQEWFPIWVWKKMENGTLAELMIVCGIEDENRDMAERMIKTAFWCVQYRPESRPLMSNVVKMLEGALEIPVRQILLHIFGLNLLSLIIIFQSTQHGPIPMVIQNPLQ
ncbi:hypothetical protein DITRI_Ditri10aG0183900 [Diplodiscus trichospermus]